jgi:hypothetical protein
MSLVSAVVVEMAAVRHTPLDNLDNLVGFTSPGPTNKQITFING